MFAIQYFVRPSSRRVLNWDHRRSGIALVEFAVALPILFLVVFGSIQACNAIFTKQFITQVSYQGAIRAARPNTSAAQVLAEMNQLLAARGIDSATLTVAGVDGTAYDTLTAGSAFRVAVSVSPAAHHSGPSVVTYATLQAESFGRKP